ncbi:Plug domain-containing protein, partial [Acinetobacter baumannii]
IRGSSLRSPFGVRNVKVYIDEMPLTDGGGNTYLNIVGLNWIDAAEIMKGPSSSIYGAGTGGVLLLKTNLPFSPQHQNEYL